jgi:hypothetical protein
MSGRDKAAKLIDDSHRRQELEFLRKIEAKKKKKADDEAAELERKQRGDEEKQRKEAQIKDELEEKTKETNLILGMDDSKQINASLAAELKQELDSKLGIVIHVLAHSPARVISYIFIISPH